MMGMRVRVRVVGNTLVVDKDVQLPPEGEELEAELRLVSDGQPDEETVQELMAALKEADAGDFVSREDVWARIKARHRE
jgi:hypothetical protein